MTTPISKWAARYIQKYGFHLVPIEPNRKYPRAKDWGENTLDNAMLAEAFYESRNDWNVGVALGPSQVCSLDIDHQEWFEIICEAFNVDLQALIKNYPTIKAKGKRLLFKVPANMDLPYVKLNWRPEEDPTGEKHRELMKQAREAKAAGDEEKEAEFRALAKPYAMQTVFELRSATDGSQKQDVLPPSIHPDTGKPYEWITPPSDEIPPLPDWLLAVWQNFDSFRKQFLAACPWADINDVYKEESAKPTRPRSYTSDGGLVLAANKYAEETPIQDELRRQGYVNVHGKRWLSPYSSTGLAGVTVFPLSNKCWIHHASDPLCSDATGQPVSSFDLFCEYQYGGKFVDAAKAVAEMMGIRSDAPAYNPTPVSQGTGMLPADIDAETGETIEAETTSFDYFAPLPWCDDKYKPIEHHDNLAEIMRRAGIEVRYNVMRKEEELTIPNQYFSVDNEANASLACLMSVCALFKFKTGKIPEFLTYLADRNHYSPVVEWVGSKPWDGMDRFQTLCDSVQSTTPDELKRTLIKRWLISAVAAAFSFNGVAAQGVLVFQGDQNLGKTTWFESLIPREVNIEHRMLQSGVLLRPDDKDSVKQACSSWLVELGEIDGSMRKSDEAQLKAFITRDEDTMRRPYARKESTYRRRTVFFGSVNPREYLKDDTGNRRFWTIECTSINPKHGIDMQQLWAQVLQWYRDGEHHWLTPDEVNQLNAVNDDHRTRDPIEERLLSAYDWEEDRTFWRYMSVTDTLLEVGIDRPTRADVTRAGAIIAQLNGGDRKRMNGQRMTLVPPKPDYSDTMAQF